ncbi:phosphoribosylaminoimidazolesuccinocarboxamide synthase [Helicobacter mustelae]|uniref:Phosphoribosylaminoimidazole-succinocarboxamide synthase n=1 Tax=Helicobacter mustelae (strain ATCC 43772 / CCUG 25715 / CIP 103759 / LMG 18044 / NCTC 12198 / R85-136P) TaxID=679897 RepID=D3UI72_HELM1|nr:phosphoribosylaminoimidazolesuccinocarboxamide synthase [Helicobacter mustelae]CBG40195.1 phosphoribosylaminoimidazole-succinocarboxamide synthase [Helicobacter mustelae 12198]SQH71697.1 phosphoribosylaminoimidazole-succinocarboxamide synthase [Helicobacter mustelae]STP12823.1 phosphoribosylaminoimidazole-succinocarboxamide synthase [Helicobacter mustelae]
MEKKQLLYEGKGKRIFATEDAGLVIAEFKDDLTAFNAQKKGQEVGKGALNCAISSLLFALLEKNHIPTHYKKTLDSTHMLCQKVEIIPIEVVVRNVATGSLSKRLGIEEGKVLPFSLVEFYYKDDELGDPLINDEHCRILGITQNQEDLEFLKNQGRKINGILQEFFAAKSLRLIDFKLEFGKSAQGEILLADEISPDSCRFWDKDTNQKLDKDIFRQDLGDVYAAYEEVFYRIRSANES